MGLTWCTGHYFWISARCCAAQAKPRKDVIDLTEGYDSELSQALAMSLSQAEHVNASANDSTGTGIGGGPSAGNDGVMFRPSTRAPDPNWAMVPSNVCIFFLEFVYERGIWSRWVEYQG